MDYVIYRYAERPEVVAGMAATQKPEEAAALVTAWQQQPPGREGLIVTLGEQPVIHCPPRLPVQGQRRPTGNAGAPD